MILTLAQLELQLELASSIHINQVGYWSSISLTNLAAQKEIYHISTLVMGDPDFINDPFFTQANLCWPAKSQGCLHMVRDQGITDCCYAFVATDTMHAERFIKGKTAYLGSVQELLDCLHNHYLPKSISEKRLLELLELEESKKGFPNTFKNAFTYIKSLGIYSEKQYPFLGERREFKEPTLNPDLKIFIEDFHRIRGQDLIIEQLCKQPLTGSILLTPSLKFWRAECGIYQGPNEEERNEIEEAKRKEKKSPYGYHALTLVGYGTEGGIEYYLCRNSYGPKWCHRGYVKIARGLLRNVFRPEGTSMRKRKIGSKRKDAGQSSTEVEDVAGEPLSKMRKIESSDHDPRQF